MPSGVEILVTIIGDYMNIQVFGLKGETYSGLCGQDTNETYYLQYKYDLFFYI